MADLDQFYELIKRILCTDNEIRKEAETAYEGISILLRCQLLFQLYSKTDCELESRNMALVLLRRLLVNSYNEISRALGTNGVEEFRDKLLEAVTLESNNGLRKRLIEAIAEFAKEGINSESLCQTWDKVLKFIAHVPTATAELREAAMLLIDNVPNIFGEQMPNYIGDIKTIFSSCLGFGDSASPVRVCAVKAFVSFVVEHEGLPKIIQPLSDQIPAIIEICKFTIDSGNDDVTVLQNLCDVVAATPKLINPHLNSLLEFCHNTCLRGDIDCSFRHSALEVMVAFTESSASVIRKRAAPVIPEMVRICMTFMTYIDDDISDWCFNDSPDICDDEEEDYSVGESSLDRLSCALGGKSLLQHLLALASEYLKSSDWKHRHAAIMAISVSGEGCKRQMEPHIENVVDTILPYLKDEHPRVRYAACNAIGQMSTDFGPTLQKKCHATVVPALLETLTDLANPRVSAHAGAALVNFSEECPKNIISIYLTDVIAKLEFVLENTFRQLLEKGKKIVLEQVITTVASVADAAKEQFIAYYDRLIPPLKYILKNTTAPEYKILRGKTIECISLIGLAVGAEKFEPDVNEIMEVVLTTQNEETVPDDPLVSYMISSWARICKILGEKFGRFLPMVMPAVMKAASVKPDVMLFEDDNNDGVGDSENWSFMNIGDNQSLGIKTSGLEEKATACEMIVCYAREAKGAFIDYVEPVMELMLPLLKFMFHDVVRMSAAECMPVLLEVALPKGADYVKKMWETILPAMQDALKDERDSDVVGTFLEELGQCVETIGPNVVNARELDIITTIINEQMEEYKKRKELYEENLKDEDADEESQEQIDDYLENETTILGKTSDIIHSLFKTFGTQYLPYFEKIGKHFADIIVDKKRQFYERQWAICVFDDVIEYGGPQSLQYQEVFLQPILDYLEDEYPEIRQAAAYGCGMMALKGGPGYAEACRQALPRLINIIQRPEARSTEEECAATENAISSVAKILKCNSSLINVNDIIPLYLSWLPIWEDEEESPFVYGYLCDLIESNHPLVVGENNSNIPRLIYIISQAFVKGAFPEGNEAEEIKGRLMNILKSVKANAELFSAAVGAANLSEDQKLFLQGSL
uniref:TOG domain-containing protein n=1 Tax=Strongyloides papillosus TaxID=174720 RepID=A0A0N5CCH7_STREA